MHFLCTVTDVVDKYDLQAKLAPYLEEPADEYQVDNPRVAYGWYDVEKQFHDSCLGEKVYQYLKSRVREDYLRDVVHKVMFRPDIVLTPPFNLHSWGVGDEYFNGDGVLYEHIFSNPNTHFDYGVAVKPLSRERYSSYGYVPLQSATLEEIAEQDWDFKKYLFMYKQDGYEVTWPKFGFNHLKIKNIDVGATMFMRNGITTSAYLDGENWVECTDLWDKNTDWDKWEHQFMRWFYSLDPETYVTMVDCHI
jgi:hypothetical protein